MNLDTYLKLSQIAFYMVGGTIAVLTYIKAKNGLLNAVNTEYKKRVMDRLAEVSRELLSEYDWQSPKHWSRLDPVKEVVDRVHEGILPHKESILKSGKILSGIPISARERELFGIVDVLKSDPFIPRKIRAMLVDFYKNRAEAMSSVFLEEITVYQQGLAEGRHWDSLERNRYWIHNNIIMKMEERGCGIGQVEEEVHVIRNAIQEYFEQFDPIRKTRA